VFSAIVAGSVTVGVAAVGVADVSAASVLSVGAGSFCDFRRAGPPPLCPLEPRPLPPPLGDLGFVVVVVAVETEADIGQGVE